MNDETRRSITGLALMTIMVAGGGAVLGIPSVMPAAEADHPTAAVGFGEGSGLSQDCVETVDCFTPVTVTVDVGGEVVWTNTDALIHNVASGGLDDMRADTVGTNWPNGEGAEGNTGFQSSFMNQGDVFKHKFDAPGEYPYFCTLHPWRAGMVIVEAEPAAGPANANRNRLAPA